MKEIHKKVPMLFIITAVIFGGAAVYHFQQIFSTYGNPMTSMGDPLWFYVLSVLFYTITTTLHLGLYFNLIYYISKAIVVKTYGFIRNMLSLISPIA